MAPHLSEIGKYITQSCNNSNQI